MNKETSSRVSTIAAKLICITPAMLDTLSCSEKPELQILCEEIRTLAASCLSQDETAGQSTVHGDFFDRLTNERTDLEARLTALNSYLTHNPGHPNPHHHEILRRQAGPMSEYLAILDERIADIEISRRSELSEVTTAHPDEDTPEPVGAATEQDDN